ncbi:c-5 sterol desaturase [Steccherinum ochraceum]|uniref:C-5 sterol desaturase n=1 Tax=Steccherinum ochraceum TaxID=92696 RepID=A0A4R0RRG5_9APHY|nr:c-5 sterol desaturase [Steccherinum ochraceum]
MDILLDVMDEYLLDNVYAKLVPATAFAPAFNASTLSKAALNATSHFPVIPAGSLSSTWSHLVSYLPHPPLPAESFVEPALSTIASTSAWPRDYILRQAISLTGITLAGVHVIYFLFAWLSYTFVFNHDMMKHPRFLKNQIRQEILLSLYAFPLMTALTLPLFVLEVRGYSFLYDNVSDYGWGYLVFSVAFYLLFTDFCIYWIHRWEHNPLWYKWLHKPHHKWIIPTPFAAYAFHPMDGFLQSIPYHIFIFMFPFHKKLYVILFVLINLWTILIHDSDMVTGHPLERIINGPAHHTLHHMYFTVNYGQYFTFADRMGDSYRQPAQELDPLLDVKKAEEKQEKEALGKQQ